MNSPPVSFFVRHAPRLLASLALLLGACASRPQPPPPVASVPDLAGTHWSVTSIDGRTTLNEPELTADFGVDGRVNGESGCNLFSGPFVQTGATVRFGELLSTRRACAEAERQRQEDRMLAVMRGATAVRLVNDELQLRGPSGSMTFMKVDNTAPVSLRRVKYDCQGVPLTVEYGDKVVRLSWPDGNDVLREQPRGNSDLVRYESRGSELRIDRDILWGREGGNPRFCVERR